MTSKSQDVKVFPGDESTKFHLKTVLVSINKQFAMDEDYIPPGAEVALFPPVSGGSFPTVFAITQDEIDLDRLLEQITLPTTGAACIFTGFVRGLTSRGGPHQTEYLEYEAYIPMAEEKMKQVADEIRRQWNTVEGIAIVQRIGKLYPRTLQCSSLVLPPIVIRVCSKLPGTVSTA